MSNCVGYVPCEVFYPLRAARVLRKAITVGDCKEFCACLKFRPQKAIEPNEEK